jgi:hypothetical protein
VIVGVEQGGALVARLLREEIAEDPELRSRLAAAYLIDTVVPAADFGPRAAIPACQTRVQTGCVLAWDQVTDDGDAVQVAKRALVWTPAGQLENLSGREALCVNPMLGQTGDAVAPNRLNLGAANATGLEWGVRPAFSPREVSAQCRDGFLFASKPASPSLKRTGGWTARLKAPPFNLFYADEEADAKTRVTALIHAPDYIPPKPPSGASISILHSPVHRIL